MHDEYIWAVTSGRGFAEVEAPPPPWAEVFEVAVHPPAHREEIFSPSDFLLASPFPFEGFGAHFSAGIVDGDLL